MTAVDPTVQKVIDVAHQVADDPNVEIAVAKVTPKIPSNVRNVLYTIGVWLGTIGTAGAPIVAALTGNAAVAGASILAAALAANSLLAKFNLSKPVKELPPASVDPAAKDAKADEKPIADFNEGENVAG